jgi:hypothetical protein
MDTAADVLAQLDKAEEQFEFPDLGHGYYYLIDARLHVLRDPARWALVVEVVGFNPRAWDVIDVLHVFGNCLTTGGPGCENSDFLGRIENATELFRDDEEEELIVVAPNTPPKPDRIAPAVAVYPYPVGRPVQLRGQRLPVDVPANTEIWDALRTLVPEHRELLLATEEELRRRIPADLPEILRLDEWNHPASFGEKPSANETFRQLAEVIETGDLRRYAPTEPPDTHWSNWPESGAL